MKPWKHGAYYHKDGSAHFRVWAPLATRASVVLPGDQTKVLAMQSAAEGYFELTVPACQPGTRYFYQLDDAEPRPDPASRYQPDGVHGPSAIVDSRFPWTDDDWAGLPLEEYVIYELHIGTFTGPGTFEAAIEELPRLKELGITAIEIMPIAQFPGSRNWGYDGVYPYAAQDSYGGLHGFQKLVDAAHALGLAVVLDVVYNHLGPEGNYLSTFGPYFTPKYQTPWGSSLNFDDQYSDGVRDYFIGNAMFWVETCHVDALRLDAVHAIIDMSSLPFLRQLTMAVHNAGRRMHKRVHVIGENDRNDPLFATSAELGGIGADSQWSDDFHHALHAILTGEKHEYYSAYGKISHLAQAIANGFVYDGCYSAHRKRYHGADSRALDGIRFVVCSQNHDQVGNRPLGERLSMLLDFPRTKLAAFTTLTSPYIPLIFMGEETASKSPFQYFISHGDESLVAAVQEGRANEFREFFATGTAPDPQSPDTYEQSKLKHNESAEGFAILNLYKDLLKFRRSIEGMGPQNKRRTSAVANDLRQTLTVLRPSDDTDILILYNFALNAQPVTAIAPAGEWHLLLHTDDMSYGGQTSLEVQVLTSEGELTVDMPASSGLLLQRVPGTHASAPNSASH